MPRRSKAKQGADPRKYGKKIPQWEIYNGEKYVETVQLQRDVEAAKQQGFRVKKIS